MRIDYQKYNQEYIFCCCFSQFFHIGFFNAFLRSEWVIRFETSLFSWHDLNKDGTDSGKVEFNKNISGLKNYERYRKRIT